MSKTPIEFQVNGLTLRGNIYNPDQNDPKLALLFLHGWTGRPNEAAAAFLANRGFITMTFSLSGHNNSDGELADQTRQKSLQEVIAAYDLLRARTKAKIVVAGNSYGGYMSALLTAERPLAAVSLRVPANHPDEHFDDKQLGQLDDVLKQKWREIPLDYNATSSLKALHNFAGPIQIIEAELDEMVPSQTVKNYVNAVTDKSKLDYHLMKGWPHSLGDSQERQRQFRDILLNWLEQKV